MHRYTKEEIKTAREIKERTNLEWSDVADTLGRPEMFNAEIDPESLRVTVCKSKNGGWDGGRKTEADMREEARGMWNMRETGASQQEIADHYQVSHTTVQNRLKLLPKVDAETGP